MNKKPTQAQISIFVHWQSISQDMSMVKCNECPFEVICETDKKKGFGFMTLCNYLNRNLKIIQDAWNLPKEIK